MGGFSFLCWCEILTTPGGALDKVIHAGFKEGLVFVAGDVLSHVGPASFGVAHLAKDPAAGAGDAFDGVDGAVGVELRIHRWIAVEVGILRGNLTGGGKLLNLFLRGVEFSLSVGKGDVVKFANLGRGQPRGKIG